MQIYCASEMIDNELLNRFPEAKYQIHLHKRQNCGHKKTIAKFATSCYLSVLFTDLFFYDIEREEKEMNGEETKITQLYTRKNYTQRYIWFERIGGYNDTKNCQNASAKALNSNLSSNTLRSALEYRIGFDYYRRYPIFK